MINKTIQYLHKNKIYKVNVSTPNSEMLHVSINNIVSGCYNPNDFVKKLDYCLGVAIRRYEIEKKMNLI